MADLRLKLIQQWRKEATERARQIRLHNYADQASRVRSYMVIVTLRRCANALMREVRRESK